MEYRVSILRDESRIDELIELFRTGLGDTTREHWKWRLFTANGMPQPEALIAEDENGKMVAMASVLSVYYGNREHKVMQFCDWVVHPEYRGQGLIGKLYRYAVEKYTTDGYDYIIEFPNDNSYPIFQKYAFDEKERIPCWNTRNRILFHKQRKNIEKRGIRYEFCKSCPVQHFSQMSDRIMRTPEFMRWKYDLNPDTAYHWLIAYRGEVVLGYFVYALTHGRIRTVVTVYDWEFDAKETDAFRTALQCLKRLGNAVSIWGKYDVQRRELLQKAGMRTDVGGTRLSVKAISEKGYPDEMTLTRIDTDY